MTDVTPPGNDALLRTPCNFCVSWRRFVPCAASAGEAQLSAHGAPDGEEREGPDRTNEHVLRMVPSLLFSQVLALFVAITLTDTLGPGGENTFSAK